MIGFLNTIISNIVNSVVGLVETFVVFIGCLAVIVCILPGLKYCIDKYHEEPNNPLIDESSLSDSDDEEVTGVNLQGTVINSNVHVFL